MSSRYDSTNSRLFILQSEKAFLRLDECDGGLMVFGDLGSGKTSTLSNQLERAICGALSSSVNPADAEALCLLACESGRDGDVLTGNGEETQ